MNKKWSTKDEAPEEFLEQFPEINNIVLQLLYNRGLKTQEEIDDFLNPDYNDHIYDPYLFKNMAQAVERIFQAVDNQEKVMIYGDYDVDGVCASVILSETLKGLGLETEVYIPFRDSEGYGLNKKAVKEFIEHGFSLVITVDCGIANYKEIKILKKGNVDVIITDHHQEPEKLPSALAIINPQIKDSGYPFSFLSGAGVAFKLIQAIVMHQEKYDSPIKLPFGFEKWLLDLVALATVADIMPLIGENRVLVERGLLVFKKTKRLGLEKLVKVINSEYEQEVNTQFISWRIAPRLNAAGRVNHASVSFDLLISKDEHEIDNLIARLEKENKHRQQLTEKMQTEALKQIGEVTDNKKMLWAEGDGWKSGVVGLVAGRLTDKFNRPSMIVTKDREYYIGSGRSIVEFDITDALKQCSDYLVRFGGHSQACGFKVKGKDNLEKFKSKIQEIAEKELRDTVLAPTMEIDMEIKLADVNWKLIEEVDKFEPFGEANFRPLFVAKNLKIEQMQAVGSDGKHLRAMVSQSNGVNAHKLIGFSFGEWCAKLNIGDKIDIVFEIGINEWNGNRELQLKIIDLKKSH